MDLFGAEVDVFPLERTEDGPPLGSDPPAPGLQAVGQGDLPVGDRSRGGGHQLSPGAP